LSQVQLEPHKPIRRDCQPLSARDTFWMPVVTHRDSIGSRPAQQTRRCGSTSPTILCARDLGLSPAGRRWQCRPESLADYLNRRSKCFRRCNI